MTFTKTYLLVDLENRQPTPEHVAAWIGHAGEAWIFYGEQQLGLLPGYWKIGKQVSIVPISRPGRNSLDFHLVLYLGYLVAKDKEARFVIVAADKDYDSAIDHARAEGIDVVRVAELPMEARTDGLAAACTEKGPAAGSVPVPGAAARTPAKVGASDRLPRKKTTSEIYAGTLKDIRGPNRPRDLKALSSRIQSRSGKSANPETVSGVLARLQTMDVIKIVDDDLEYLPTAS